MEHTADQKIIRSLSGASEERPYERCLSYGAGVLSDAELLAVIMRTGTQGMSAVELAHRVLSMQGAPEGLAGLCQRTPEELMEISGIGRAKAVQLVCVGELSKRIAQMRSSADLSFSHPKSIADYYMERFRHQTQEHFFVIALDNRLGRIGEEILTKGGSAFAPVPIRELLRTVLRMNASSIVVMHNHPSGDPTPSPDDIRVTERIREAAALLEIQLLDHIIIGDRTYFSFRESGLIINKDAEF